jgi:Skp family chaperone for outer membrane proteins|tara:strand:- start:94 stop:624 length:531 start_codon:yes stop_codon:yes gene_type:complete
MIYRNIFNIVILFFLISLSSIVKSAESVAFINMDYIMNNSLAGKSISGQLKKAHQSDLDNFKKKEENLKLQETKIISQKNVLDKIEYEKKITLLRKNVSEYRNLRNKKINELTKKRLDAQALLIKTLNPILAEYAQEKSISLIIQKKYVIIGKSELDITKEILKILDKKVKKINFK